jgi:hypothetical protein
VTEAEIELVSQVGRKEERKEMITSRREREREHRIR